MAEVTSTSVLDWVDAYERAWRARDVSLLRDVFAPDAVYLTEPYATPVVGLDAISALWLEESDPGEVFVASYAVVACQGPIGVVRADVRYGDPVEQEYADLWLVTFDDQGRAARFEEWPFWPTHGRSPAHREDRA